MERLKGESAMAQDKAAAGVRQSSFGGDLPNSGQETTPHCDSPLLRFDKMPL